MEVVAVKGRGKRRSEKEWCVIGHVLQVTGWPIKVIYVMEKNGYGLLE
jgi:hypothetical protein